MRRILIVAAALSLFGAAAPAGASEPTGSFLGGYYDRGGLWGQPAEGQAPFGIFAGLRTEYLDREAEFNGSSDGFSSFRLGPEITFSYQKFFLTGSYLHSVTSEDLGDDETCSYGYNVHLGYATSVGRNLILAPVVGYGGEYTKLESKIGNFHADEGVHGVSFGVLFNYTLPYDMMLKPYPKWMVFGSGLYYPSLSVTDDFGNIDGDEGWAVGFGVRYNVDRRSSLAAIFNYREFNASGPGVDVNVRDWSAGLTYTYAFGRQP
jgi:opacity protein-like surface antigen